MDAYQESIFYFFNGIKEYKKLNKKQIAKYKYPWNMFLYAIYNYTKELNQFDLNQINNELIGNYRKLNILSFSAFYGKIKVVKYLISRNANLFVKDYCNNIYMLAVEGGNLKMLKYLDTLKIIKEDYSFYFSIDFDGFHISSLAVASEDFSNPNSLKIIKYLEKQGIYIENESLRYAHYANNNKIVSYLYSRGYRFKNLNHGLIYAYPKKSPIKIDIWNTEYKYSGHILYIN
jgi:hypothetical protein